MSPLRRKILCALSSALCFGAGNAMAEVVVVVSPRSALVALSSNQITDIFLGKTSRFPNGQHAVPVDLAEGSAERNEFYRKFADKTPAQIKAHWSKIIFTGRGQPPKEVLHDQGVKKMVAVNPGYIGYIDRSSVDEKVKVVQVQE